MPEYLHWILGGLHAVAAVTASGHALLSKRDPRAALGWIGVSLTFPLGGPLLYFFFGINRIQTRARSLTAEDFREEVKIRPVEAQVDVPREFSELDRISAAISSRALVAGNRIEILHNGEQAYPPMLDAIETALDSIFLSTYIFETNRTGRRFVEALAGAAARGVDVKVLVDGFGELYSRPRVTTLLARRGVSVARFLPPKLLPPALHINLRNHRKILLVDGSVAFTGGMNIGDRHLVEQVDNSARTVDVHFRLQGPIVEQLRQVFCEDWTFATGEGLEPSPGKYSVAGQTLCRALVEGPDEDLDKLSSVLLGAASAARQQIAIMTPYFLPSRELTGALQAAALRGVEVAIIVPEKNNLPFVQWASDNMLWDLLRRGVSVYRQPAPFAHTKLFVLDGHYVQLGSANIDPRSLRLNFELTVEVYDRAFAKQLVDHFDSVRTRSRRVTFREMEARPLPIRVRDALAWLMSPYL